MVTYNLSFKNVEGETEMGFTRTIISNSLRKHGLRMNLINQIDKMTSHKQIKPQPSG